MRKNHCGQLALLDQRAGAPAAAVDHLLVGQHGVVDRVPVDLATACGRPGRPRGSRETASAGGGSSPSRRSRISRAQSSDRPIDLQLRLHLRDVLRRSRRADATLRSHGGVLGRHAEGVPAHRMQHVEALGALVPRDHVAHGVVAHVAHMDAPRRIGEHLQDVVFRPRIVVRASRRCALRPQAAASAARLRGRCSGRVAIPVSIRRVIGSGAARSAATINRKASGSKIGVPEPAGSRAAWWEHGRRSA